MNGIQNQSSQDDEERRSCNSTEGHCLEEPRKRRGRPVGSKNKAKVPDIEGRQGEVRGDIVGDNLWAAGPLTVLITFKVLRPPQATVHNGNGIGEGIMLSSPPSSSAAAQCIRQPNQNNVFSSTRCPLPPPPPVHLGKDSSTPSPLPPNHNNAFATGSSTPGPLPPLIPPQANVHNEFNGFPQASVHNEFNGFPQASVHNKYNGFASTPLQASVHMNEHNGFPSTNVHTEYPSCTPPPHHVPARMSNEYPPSAPPGKMLESFVVVSKVTNIRLNPDPQEAYCHVMNLETGGYLGESSHARGEEAPSSYIDDVVLMTEEELTQIQEGILTTISFGLDSFTGTSSTSAGLCDSGSGSAVGDKGKRIIGFTSLLTTPTIPEDEKEEEEDMPRVHVVYENIENIPPLPKTYIKSPAKPKRKSGDEDPSEPSNTAKIDFDDPSVA
ncbi:hypothetical protein SUGI_0199990 [Cryptomeria japonica]|nr:hypothetical protein SUGI_0199990 [Cryptomeria japonica]